MVKKIDSFLFFRISLWVSLFLLGCLVLLCLTAIHTGGNLKVAAQFFSVAPRSFTQLKEISPIESGTKDKAMLDEMLMRYYLETRYTQMPDASEMRYRWGIGGPLYYLSLPSLYNDFAKDVAKKIDDLPDVVKTIEIKRVTRQDNVFIVDFMVYENYPEGQVRAQQKNAVLEFVYLPARRVLGRPHFNNPYGLTFIRFEETERKNN